MRDVTFGAEVHEAWLAVLRELLFFERVPSKLFSAYFNSFTQHSLTRRWYIEPYTVQSGIRISKRKRDFLLFLRNLSRKRP